MQRVGRTLQTRRIDAPAGKDSMVILDLANSEAIAGVAASRRGRDSVTGRRDQGEVQDLRQRTKRVYVGRGHAETARAYLPLAEGPIHLVGEGLDEVRRCRSRCGRNEDLGRHAWNEFETMQVG